MYAIELLSFGNGIYIAFIYLLNTIEVSKAIAQVVDLLHSLHSRRYSRARENGKIEIPPATQARSYSKRYTFGHKPNRR